MDVGLNEQARTSRGRVLALVFFLGMFVGLVIGYAIASDEREITREDVMDGEDRAVE